LSDEADLDMAIERGQLATHSGAVAVGLAVQVLRAAVARDSLHATHSEVIVVGTENSQRLLEGQFDLEAQSIAADDIDGRESQDGGAEDATGRGQDDRRGRSVPGAAAVARANPGTRIARSRRARR